MYFENMPKIQYDFLKNYNVEMQDIFRRVSFTQETLNNPENFITYTVVEGESPDQVSIKFYDSPDYWWLILLTNNIIDYQNEWPRSVNDMDRLFENFLAGNSYYIFEDIDIQKEDIIVKRDVTATDSGGDHTSSLDMNVYGVVDNYDRILHKIDVKKQKGTISGADEIYVFRKGITSNGSSGSYYLIEGFGQTGCYKPYFGATTCVEITGPTGSLVHGGSWGELCVTSGSTFAIVQKATTIKDSVVKFEYKSEQVNPYAAVASGTGDFFSLGNICGMSGTILYNYITDSLPDSVKRITKQDDVLRTNDLNRTISILSPDLLGILMNEISTLFNSNIPRGTTKLIKRNY